MSIAPPVGAMSAYLARLGSGRTYLKLRDVGKQLTRHLPKVLDRAITRAVEHARTYVTGGTLFEELGFYYVGPIDGHNLDHLLPVLRNVRDAEIGPILVHVVTQKGKGYAPAETSADKYHGVVKFDVATGAQAKSKGGAPQYTKVFGESLIKEARKDEKIVAVTAAMPSGTGLDLFEKEFPNRCFDVGIAEQHAVTFCGRAGDRRLQAVLRRSIRPSCSAPMTRWCTTSPSSGCRCALRSTAPVWSGPTGRPMPAPSTSPISAACRASC